MLGRVINLNFVLWLPKRWKALEPRMMNPLGLAKLSVMDKDFACFHKITLSQRTKSRLTANEALTLGSWINFEGFFSFLRTGQPNQSVG